MKGIVREHPKILAEKIYNFLKTYAKSQENGICRDQIERAFDLVLGSLRLERIEFQK